MDLHDIYYQKIYERLSNHCNIFIKIRQAQRTIYMKTFIYDFSCISSVHKPAHHLTRRKKVNDCKLRTSQRNVLFTSLCTAQLKQKSEFLFFTVITHSRNFLCLRPIGKRTTIGREVNRLAKYGENYECFLCKKWKTHLKW